jgi:putative transposase
MNLAHQIQFYPYTDEQETLLRKSCGVARFTYNWALAQWTSLYKSGEKPTAFKLKKQFNSIRKQEFPWTYEVSKCASEQSFTNLGKAFSNFFQKTSKYPKFKKKGVRDSFYISNDKFKLEGKKLKLPKIGWVKLTEGLRFSGKIMNLTVSRKADRWFVSFNVELTPEDLNSYKLENQEVIGLDLGINKLVTLSNGQVFDGPKPLKSYLKKVKRLSKRLSKKIKGSKNRDKAREKLAKLHLRISNIRKDSLHKITTNLVKDYGVICMEDLNVKGMMRNHKLAKAISDMGFHEFKRQLEYKMKLRNGRIIKVDRFYPSSKTCSECGNKKETMSLGEREYQCESCGIVLDRDINAAINIKREGIRTCESP